MPQELATGKGVGRKRKEQVEGCGHHAGKLRSDRDDAPTDRPPVKSSRRRIFAIGAMVGSWLVLTLGASAIFARANGADAPDGRFILAQLLPFERNKVEPIDPRKAFVEAYQAYQRRDYFAVIERMPLVAKSLPGLADYALYYLGEAQRANGDAQDAALAFGELTQSYPQSVFADAGNLEYARVEIELGHPGAAIAAASRVAGNFDASASAQNAQILIAKAQVAAGNYRAAYDEAQALREHFPRGANDADARALCYSLVQRNPGLAEASSLRYRTGEAALLIREGKTSLALDQVRSALQMGPPAATRAELAWLYAEALQGNVKTERAALARYLILAPTGPHASTALSALAHSYWRADDTARARVYFGRIVREFRGSSAAAKAVFETGRTYEDDGEFESARSEYVAVIKRYAGAGETADARFRAPFMLYMAGRYEQAAQEFGRLRARATDPA